MPLTPEEQATIRASLSDPATTNARLVNPNAPTFDDTMANRLRSTFGRTLQNPVVSNGLAATTSIPAQAFSAAGTAVAPDGAIPSGRNPTSMVRAEPAPPTQLAPTNANDVTIDPAAPLALTRPKVGGGGMGGPAPTDGLRATWMGDQRAQIGLIGEEAQRTANLGVAKADRAEGEADLTEQHALKIQEMADIQKKADEDADQRATAFLDQNKRMADELAQAKVQPGHLWAEKGAGERMAFGVAAALSGLASGLTGKPDQFISTWEHAIDRDIAAQQAAIDNKKSALSSRQSLFGQFLQQTGDRRVAAAATRNLMLDGLKTQISAQSARLGLPEVAAQADILVNGVQQKQAAAQTGFDGAIMQWKQQQAAAAANAQAQARKDAWEREIKTTELAQKQDELNIKRLEVEGKKQDKTGAEVTELGKQLSDDKLSKGRAAVDALATQLAKTPEGDQIAGRTLTDRALLSLPGGAHIVSNQANINRQNEKDLDLAYQQMITGSGGSDEQMQRIYEAAKGAGTSAEFANQVNKLRDYYVHREEKIRSGASPEAVAQYDANQARLKNKLPDSVKVTKPADDSGWSGLNPSNPWTKK